ncbi:MAG: site-2 protease family protein [Christensenellaceae bacterium]|nr:site-2 protease family protein [Christensenellaceae bacterium]MEA5064584.1 site-2 protease family protein [Eubacteriales bacterium]MEA5068399.1 site-2 protease family protein [Christensenellaceae bacterium]
MTTIPYLLLALVVIGLMIFIHELGHYLAGRASGIGVVEFSIGFGPRLVSWRRGCTIYSVRLLIPLGGFCKFAGEDEAEHWYPVPRVAALTDAPAREAGMRPGDIVRRAQETEIPFDVAGAELLNECIREAGEAPLKLMIERDGAPIELTVKPRLIAGEAQIGALLERVDDCALPRVVHAENPGALMPGDLIVKVGRRPIEHSPSGAMAVNRLLDRADGSPLHFTVERGGRLLAMTAAPGKLTLGNTSHPLPGEGTARSRPRTFNQVSVGRRMATIFAGPFMNFVLAFGAALVFWLAFGFLFSAPKVADVDPQMNAAAAGMRPGDVIVEVAGEVIAYSGEGTRRLLDRIAAADPNEPIALTVDRAGERVELAVRPTQTPDGWRIGIMLGAEVYYPSLPEALRQSFISVKQASLAIVRAFRAMLTTGEGLDQTAGPVGLVSIMTEEVKQGGASMLLNLILVISVNFGIMNLLPLPALDGGRLAFLLVEAIRRKPVKPEHEAWVHAVGLMLFMALFAVVTFRDVARLFTGR